MACKYGCWCVFLLQKFLGSLSNAAKVYTFQAVSALLRMVFDVEDEKTVKVRETYPLPLSIFHIG